MDSGFSVFLLFSASGAGVAAKKIKIVPQATVMRRRLGRFSGAMSGSTYSAFLDKPRGATGRTCDRPLSIELREQYITSAAPVITRDNLTSRRLGSLLADHRTIKAVYETQTARRPRQLTITGMRAGWETGLGSHALFARPIPELRGFGERRQTKWDVKVTRVDVKTSRRPRTCVYDGEEEIRQRNRARPEATRATSRRHHASRGREAAAVTRAENKEKLSAILKARARPGASAQRRGRGRGNSRSGGQRRRRPGQTSSPRATSRA